MPADKSLLHTKKLAMIERGIFTSLILAAITVAVQSLLQASPLVSIAYATDSHSVAHNMATKGAAEMQNRKYRAALPYLKQAVALDPKNANVQFLLGETYFALDQKVESIKTFNEAFRLDPACNLERPFKELGQALVVEDRAPEAIAVFTRGLTNIPANGELLCERGCTYTLLDQFQKGVSDLTEAIKAKPTYGHYYQQRAMIYHSMHQYENAIKDYTQLIKLDPQSSKAYASRANVYKAMGKLDLAAKDRAKSATLGVVDQAFSK